VGCRAKGSELVRLHGVTEQTLYRWKKKYGGMQVNDARRLKGSKTRTGNSSALSQIRRSICRS
jgi:hypothetical protein